MTEQFVSLNGLASKLDAIISPDGRGHGLPNSAYTDLAHFNFERDEVLATTWVAIGYASDVADIGCAKPVNFMGFPLLILRNKDAEIRVFHNVCSHRGMLLVQEESRLRTVIRCPYHSWSYDFDGQLVSTPLIGGTDVNSCDGFEKNKHGLKSIRFSVWMDIVFVNLSGTAESFEDYIEPLENRWRPFWGAAGAEQFRPAASGSNLELTVKTNWKLAVENYCEAYHLPWVHPALNSYSPLQEHFNISDDQNMAGQGTYQYELNTDSGMKLPKLVDWPAEQIRHAEYLALYPNTLLGLQADHAFSVIVVPGAAASTQERLQILYADDAPTNERYADTRKEVLASWQVVFAEDIFAVEGMQAGRSSPGFDGGVLTPLQDVPTQHFHRWVAGQYKKALKNSEFK